MSTIYRDYLAPARAKWALNSATYELFKKSWGTTWINGVQVYNGIMIYNYNGVMVLNETQKRFIRKIGLSYDKLSKQNYGGLDYAYFSLNAAKYLYEPMDEVQIAADLEGAFNIGDEFEVAVNYGGDLKRFVSEFVTSDGSNGYTVDTVAIRAMLNSDKIKYFANAALEPAGFGIAEESDFTIYTGTNTTPAATPVTKLSFNDITVTTEVTVSTRVLTTIDSIITYETTDTVVTTINRNIDPNFPTTTVVPTTSTVLVSLVPNTNNDPEDDVTTVGDTVTTVNDRSIYDCLAMIDNETSFEEIEIRNEIVSAVKTSDQYGNVVIVGEYSYIVKFRVIATINQASYITTTCSSLAHTLATAFTYTGFSYYSVTNAALDTLIKRAILLMSNPSSNPAFYAGYLRVDYCESIPRKDFVDIFKRIFDSGYKVHEESSSWFEKIVAVVIIIVAIVLIFFQQYWAAALLLSIGQIVYSMVFPNATDMIKLLGNAAQIAGYINLVNAIYTGSISAYFMAAAEAGRLAGLDAKYIMIIQLVGVAAGYYQQQQQDLARIAAEENAARQGLSAEAVKEAGKNAFSSTTFSISEAVESILDTPAQLIEKISNMDLTATLTKADNITMGDVSGWMDNLNKAMELYTMFFITPFVLPIGSNDESQKEDGVENYYITMDMLDDTDLLNRMSKYKEDMFGGQCTQNYLSTIA